MSQSNKGKKKAKKSAHAKSKPVRAMSDEELEQVSGGATASSEPVAKKRPGKIRYGDVTLKRG